MAKDREEPSQNGHDFESPIAAFDAGFKEGVEAGKRNGAMAAYSDASERVLEEAANISNLLTGKGGIFEVSQALLNLAQNLKQAAIEAGIGKKSTG